MLNQLREYFSELKNEVIENIADFVRDPSGDKLRAVIEKAVNEPKLMPEQIHPAYFNQRFIDMVEGQCIEANHRQMIRCPELYRRSFMLEPEYLL